MDSESLEKLAQLIESGRDGIAAEWRTKVRQLPSARDLETPVLQNHIPALLDDLAAVMVAHPEDSESIGMQAASEIHGVQRLQSGFNIVEVVAEYSLLREVIKDFAARNSLHLEVGDVTNTIARFIDKATGLAVQTYSDHKTMEMQRRREEHFSFVVHDLKTPLSALHTAAKILKEKVLPETQSELGRTLIDMILRNATRLNAIIKSAITESANLEAPDWLRLECRQIDLWPLVQSLVDDLRPLADETHTTLVNDVPSDLTVFADASVLTQAVQNLLSNAINYTMHGEVSVGARSLPNGTIECWVADTGAGIPEDRIGKIFEKLETDRSRRGGLGLGLAIVKQFIEAHGGEIRVESTVGEGSTFLFTLPPREQSEQSEQSQQIPA
jgi:signal transduction histidine kinase